MRFPSLKGTRQKLAAIPSETFEAKLALFIDANVPQMFWSQPENC